MTHSILCGDMLVRLGEFPENHFSACVTDPPYGLSFMGAKWDYDVPTVDQWKAVLRVLKPGAHLLSFFGTRTYHRGAVAIEDAGFEIRDCIAWVYGSGMPKSHNGPWGGTALKPAHEPIVVARKPITGTVANNFLQYGTGGLTIDGCRVPAVENQSRTRGTFPHSDDSWGNGRPNEVSQSHALGRFPANLIHDGSPEVLECFPDAPGAIRGVGPQFGAKTSVNAYGDYGPRQDMQPRGDSGSAARFFYCAKASKEDRDEGLEGLPDKLYGMSGAAAAAAASGEHYDNGDGGFNQTKARKNHHPTVKPTALMRYLCRLVTPANGIILDPFCGSGSTGKAAALEHFQFIGIDLNPEFCNIAKARITHALTQASTTTPNPQLNLFQSTEHN